MANPSCKNSKGCDRRAYHCIAAGYIEYSVPKTDDNGIESTKNIHQLARHPDYACIPKILNYT